MGSAAPVLAMRWLIPTLAGFGVFDIIMGIAAVRWLG